LSLLPKNIRLGRHGRIGILKKIPHDLWQHPRYRDKAKVIERSTGTADEAAGIAIAKSMLDDLDQEFARCRADLKGRGGRKRRAYVRGSGTDGGVARTRLSVGEQTRREILAAGMREFSEKGLKGARIDDIAAQARTTKPMIYYHFGSKEKLYAAVMEVAYGGMRDQEKGLHLEDLPPEVAMRRLVEVTFDHHAAHPEYVRLVTVENMERGRHIAGRPSLVKLNSLALETIRNVLDRGEREGVFRSGLNAWQVHLLINSFCFMRVSNRYTWRAIFEVDLWQEDNAGLQRQMITESVLRYLKR
jgi:AcrR family transcriptional regulator